MPSPAAAGAAVLLMLGAGVLAAVEASPPASATPAAARAPIVIDLPAAQAPAAEPEADVAAEREPAVASAGPAAAAPSPESDVAVAAAPPAAAPPAPAEPTLSPATGQDTPPPDQPTGEDSPTPDQPTGEDTPTPDQPTGEDTPTPDQPAGEDAPAPGQAALTVPPVTHAWIVRLAQRTDELPSLAALRAQGGWLAGYRPLGDGGLQDVVALLGGQDACADPAEPCAFGPDVHTVFDQIDATGRTWRAYVEDHLGPASCAGQPATPADPFGAFASLADAAGCVPLSTLDPATDPPELSLVLPGLAKLDPAAADAWLTDTVAAITVSPAFADGGLVVVTLADGALVLSPSYVAPGTQVDTQADAFSLLRTLQDAFGLPTLARSADAAPLGHPLWTAWSQDVHRNDTSS